MRRVLPSLAFLLAVATVAGCNGKDDGFSTKAEPVAYPGGFPVAATAATGASWYEVSGLTTGTMYMATLIVTQPGPNIDLEIYSAFDPSPPNLLCAGRSDSSFNESCSFQAAGAKAWVMVLNKGGVPPDAGFADGSGAISLLLTAP